MFQSVCKHVFGLDLRNVVIKHNHKIFTISLQNTLLDVFIFWTPPPPRKGLEFCLEIVTGVLSVRAADDLEDLKKPEVPGLEVSLTSPLFSVSMMKAVEDEGEADWKETREAEICSLTTWLETVLTINTDRTMMNVRIVTS